MPHTLKLDLHRRGRLPLDECLKIGLALTTALEHLHEHRLVHRDIKPSNIIFVNGVPKLADIGLVATMDATVSFVGTSGFLPPEGPGTPQADLYSLDKVLYEMAMGRDRQEFPKLPADLAEFQDPSRLLELNTIILKACHNDPRQRALLGKLAGHTAMISSLAFALDAKTLASGSWDSTVKLWNLRLRREVATLRAHSGQVTQVAFAPDGNTLASASSDGTVRFWRAAPLNSAAGRTAAGR